MSAILDIVRAVYALAWCVVFIGLWVYVSRDRNAPTS